MNLSAFNCLSQPLTVEQSAKLDEFSALLIEKNESVNLTAIKIPEEIEVKHFADSLAGADFIPLNARIVDLGAGAGFPSVPLAIYRSDIRVTSVDSVNKKSDFLRDAAVRLGITNLTVLNGRIENLGRTKEYREIFDVAVARALAPLRVLAEYAAPMIKKGGYFLAYKGQAADAELIEAQNALKVLSLKLVSRKDFLLNGEYARTVLLFEKTDVTKNLYPRTSKKITSQPL